MEIIRRTDNYIVCVKPSGVLSTDEPGGLPELLREQTGLEELYPVHRLDRVVGGLMLVALSKEAAAVLGNQVAERRLDKEYLAVIHGCPAERAGSFADYLQRDRQRRMTFVAPGPGKFAREALLDYEVLASGRELSLVKVRLHTGRTHQIRVQFSSRGLPLMGDRKYGTLTDETEIGLWSYSLSFEDYVTGERISLRHKPPADGTAFEPFGAFLEEYQ